MFKVKDLTVDELKELIEQTAEQKLEELLGDPDEGPRLQEETKTRLQRSSTRERRYARGILAAEALRN